MERKTHDAARRLLLRQSLALAGAAAFCAPGRALAAGCHAPRPCPTRTRRSNAT